MMTCADAPDGAIALVSRSVAANKPTAISFLMRTNPLRAGYGDPASTIPAERAGTYDTKQGRASEADDSSDGPSGAGQPRLTLACGRASAHLRWEPWRRLRERPRGSSR